MAKYDTFREILKCDCGHETRDYFYSELSDELNLQDESIEDFKVMVCDNCKSEYEVSLEVKLEISVEHNSIVKRAKTIIYKDKDYNDFYSSKLESLFVGDDVNLEDGEYTHNDKVYLVGDGKITSILSAVVDENQMSFGFENIRRPEFEYELEGYGMATDIYNLPVGTEFSVNNGAWDGEIIDIDGEKYMHIIETGKKVKLDEHTNYGLSVYITNDNKDKDEDEDYGIPY